MIYVYISDLIRKLKLAALSFSRGCRSHFIGQQINCSSGSVLLIIFESLRLSELLIKSKLTQAITIVDHSRLSTVDECGRADGLLDRRAIVQARSISP